MENKIMKIALIFCIILEFGLGSSKLFTNYSYENDKSYINTTAYVNKKEYQINEYMLNKAYIGFPWSKNFHPAYYCTDWIDSSEKCTHRERILVDTWFVTPGERIELYYKKGFPRNRYILPGEILLFRHPVSNFFASLLCLVIYLRVLKNRSETSLSSKSYNESENTFSYQNREDCGHGNHSFLSSKSYNERENTFSYQNREDCGHGNHSFTDETDPAHCVKCGAKDPNWILREQEEIFEVIFHFSK